LGEIVLFAEDRLAREPSRACDRPTGPTLRTAFRDYLRAHPHTAAAYAELKRRVAALGISRGVYVDVKNPACDIIMVGAYARANTVSWKPGPPDA
jgi:GrpB-like predicted nucleotidyltransferase (UPF0157 family)